MTTLISSVLFVSLLIPTSGQTAAVGAGAQGNRPSVLVRASTTQQPADGGWPRAYVTTSGARLVLYEPQIARWLDQKRMAMYAAVSYTSADQSSTALGTVRIDGDPIWSRPTASSLEGPWKSLQTALPASFSKLPDDDNWKGPKAALGAQCAGVATAAPTVFVSKTPAELMLLNGGAAYTPVKGTHHEWVSNTASDVFRLGTTDTVYYLVPGRGGGGFRGGG
jgi:hypothetical protein